MNDLACVVKPGKTSELDKEAKRKIWFREHSSTIMPIITLLTGFLTGSIVFFFLMQFQFSEQKSEYELQITELENIISQKDLNSGNEKSTFDENLTKKDEIINLLAQQNKTLAGVINFTRRLSGNSTITPSSQDDVDYFKRNFIYLQNQYSKQKQSLDDTEYQQATTYNLITIPQLFEVE